MKVRLKDSFNILVGILLSVSLSSFLIFFVQESKNLDTFFFNSLIVASLYILFIYSFSFYDLKKTHFIVPRTAILLLLSFLPYVILRTLVEEPLQKLTSGGLFIYLVVLFIISSIWGWWESIFYKSEVKMKEIKKEEILNFRTILSLILLILIIIMKVNNWGFV